MKQLLIILCVAFQICILAYMAIDREHLLATGKTVVLLSAPIDPRDVMRGDYIRLDCDISKIPMWKTEGSLRYQQEGYRSSATLYTVLKTDENGVSSLDYATNEKPDEDILFLKGSFKPSRYSNARYIDIKYGIEKYFVEQGSGKAIENRRGTSGSIQTPLRIDLAVGSKGEAAIKGFEWNRLGIGLTRLIEKGEPMSNPEGITLKIMLQNVSEQTLGIVDLPFYNSFILKPAHRCSQDWKPNIMPALQTPTDDDVIILQPGQFTSFIFDLSDPRWFIMKDGSPVSTGSLDWMEMFRIVYQPPNSQQCNHLKRASIIWHGALPSRSFHGAGYID
ncbi:GDYXXLXY domain-containing protein [bacterium]|nr:GDYXXLXY domain-containing protein [candidate division CSSED10-310 bacterium]